MPTFAEKRLALEERAPRQDANMAWLEGSIELDRRAEQLIKLRTSQITGAPSPSTCRGSERALSARARSGSRCSAPGARAHSTTSASAGLELCEAVRLVADGHVPDKAWEEAEATSKPDELRQVVFAIVINAWNRLVITARTGPGHYQPALANAA